MRKSIFCKSARAFESRSTRPVAPLNGYSESDPVIRRVDQILLRAQIPLGRLHGRVAQKQLNLLKLAARGAT